MKKKSSYTTNLDKGIGLIQETFQILEVYNQDFQKKDLKTYLYQNNILSKNF